MPRFSAFRAAIFSHGFLRFHCRCRFIFASAPAPLRGQVIFSPFADAAAIDATHAARTLPAASVLMQICMPFCAARRRQPAAAFIRASADAAMPLPLLMPLRRCRMRFSAEHYFAVRFRHAAALRCSQAAASCRQPRRIFLLARLRRMPATPDIFAT